MVYCPRLVYSSASRRRLLPSAALARRSFGRCPRIEAPSVSLSPSHIEFLHRSPEAKQRQKRVPCGWRKPIVVASYGTPATAAVPEEEVSERTSENAKTTATGVTGEASSASTREEQMQHLRSGDSNVDGQQHPHADLLNLKVDMEELHTLASKRCTPLRLSDMYKYAIDVSDPSQRLRNAQFLHKELPIRIAQRAVDLLALPYGLSDAIPVRQVAHVYLRYLQKFQESPVPNTPQEEDRFTDMLQSLVLDRTSIPTAIAHGVAAWQAASSPESMLDEARYKEMDDTLYRFFMARVGLRFLTEHHILSSPARAGTMELNRLDGDEKPQLGCIQKDCCPAREIRKVAAQTTQQTKERYGICPEIQIVEVNNNNHSAPVRFTYVPHHLQYMVGELLQNSCQVTVRNFFEGKKVADYEGDELPPIRVVIVKGEEDVTIKVADKGGGIPRSKMANIWKFAHTTKDKDDDNILYDFGIVNIRGFGLPLARIYARYLGGELTLKSMEGYGLDAYLHLPRLGDSCENLPLRVMTSPGDKVSLPKRGKRPIVLPKTHPQTMVDDKRN